MGTHSFTILDISPKAWDEIAAKLRSCGYEHCISANRIRMDGVALQSATPEPVNIIIPPAPAPKKRKNGECETAHLVSLSSGVCVWCGKVYFKPKARKNR